MKKKKKKREPPTLQTSVSENRLDLRSSYFEDERRNIIVSPLSLLEENALAGSMLRKKQICGCRKLYPILDRKTGCYGLPP